MVQWEEMSSTSHVSLTCFLFLTSPIHCHSFAYVFSAIQSVSCTRAPYPLSTCRNSFRNSGPGLKCHLLFNASLGPSPIKMYISLLSSACTSIIIRDAPFIQPHITFWNSHIWLLFSWIIYYLMFIICQLLTFPPFLAPIKTICTGSTLPWF